MNDFEVNGMAEEERRSPLDLKILLLYGVARSRILLVLLAVAGAMFGLLFGASQPNVYTAESLLRFQPSARQLVTDESVFGIELGDPTRRLGAGMEDELELLRDPAIYERVVDELGATMILRVEDPSSGDGPNASLPVRMMHGLQGFLIRFKGLDDPCPDGEGPECRQGAIDALMANTTLEPIKRTSLIQVSYTSTSPAKAKVICEALLAGFRKRHIEEFQAQRHLDTHREQVEDAFQALNKAKNAYDEYREQCGVYNLEVERDAIETDIADLERSLEQQEIDRRRLQAQIASLEEQLENPDGTHRGGATVVNPMYAALYEQRTELLMEIGRLGNNDDIGKISQSRLERSRDELTALERQMSDMEQFVDDPFAAPLAGLNNPAVAQAQYALTTTRASFEGLVDQMEAERELLTKLLARRDKVYECETQHFWHQQVLAGARAKFERLSDQSPNLDTLAVMDQEGRSNLSVFRAPRMPLEKDGPQRARPFLIGLFLGLGLGVALAALRQVLDRSIRYSETVEHGLGLRVLCVVPELAELDSERHAA